MSKRILSLVLALVMVLGTFGTVFAETAETTLDPKVQWLIDQELLQGDGTGDYGLDKTVTRDVLARIVAVALQDEESAKALQALPSGFVDMTPSHWANGYASYANAKGYMVGNAKRQFMPAGTTTYAEALVVLTKIALNGDLTAAEKANALTWYAPYVAKANEIGVTEGVSIANVGAPAVKEDILKMLYNVLNNKNFGNYNVIKAIVLENDRIARVGKNEVTVEVIKEVQRANFVDASREDLKGEQYTYELPAKFNAEDLLGKVVDLSIDKNDKVVEVKVDSSYEVLTGAVSGITASRLTINKKQYIVNLDERYNKEDERVYRTYLNDKDLKYSDFAKDHETVEYARVTVKSGKVLFIDAYDFNDIQPVKEVKEIRGSNHIVSYDDVRDGNLIETKVSDARVILVNGKTFTRGTLEDVKADNVIHTYKVGTSTKYVVLQDKAISGKLDKITEDKDGDYIVVDGEEYTIPTESPKEAVYEFSTDGKFYTLSAKTAYRELDTFRGETVKVLLALNEEVQYVGSDKGFGEFVGVATRIVGKEMRVHTPENKANDYVANLDTDVYVAGTKTAHQGLNRIEENSLVYVNADGETLVEVRDYDDQVAVNKLTEREINGLRITDDTVVFVVNTKGRVEVRKIADVVKAYDKLSASDKSDVKVSLIDEAEFNKVSVRGYKYARADHVQTMVLYNLNIKPAEKDAVYGKLIRYTDRKASGRSTIVIELSTTSGGTERTFTLDSSVKEENVNFVRGNIYKIIESKETADLALAVDKVSFNGYKEIKSINNYLYTFKDGTELYETRSTDIFGRSPRAGDKVSYVLDEDYNKDMVVIVNPGFEGDVKEDITGVVSFANIAADGTGNIIVDSKTPYSLDNKTVVTDNSGKILFIGGAKVGAPATKLANADLDGAKVDVIAKDGVATTVKIVKSKSDLAAEVEKEVVNTELAKVKDSYTVANTETNVLAAIDTLVNDAVDTTKVTVNVTQVGTTNKYKVELVSKTINTVKASKEVTATTAAVSRDTSVKSVTVKDVAATVDKDNSLIYNVTLPVGTTVTASDVAVVPTHAKATATIVPVAGTTNWTAVVTAEDTTVTKTYTIKVTIIASKDATLTDLKVNGTTVASFDPATLTYNVVLPYGATNPVVTATEATGATKVITNVTALPGAATVVVTAEDGTATKTYTVNFTVATVTGLTVDTQPTKVAYNNGENLELAGLKVEITYSNGDSEVVDFADFVSKGLTATPADGTALAVADTTVTITHVDGETTTVTITVTP